MKDCTTNERQTSDIKQGSIVALLFTWLALCLIIGVLSGSASALLLVCLDWVTDWREAHPWIIALLPLAGLGIGAMYHYWGASVAKGNNVLIEEVYNPQATVPLKMAPFIFIGTLLTHLFGGSAGREGTAVQMGGAIADQFTRIFGLEKRERPILLILGISAGFASVFGTPIAGAVFALELFVAQRVRYQAILPSFVVAFVAYYACAMWGVEHTVYTIPTVPPLSSLTILYTIVVGILFGITAFLFSFSTRSVNKLFAKIKYPPLRPFIGGILLVLAVWGIGTTKYIGLGIPTIVEAFSYDLNSYDFLLKILFTAVTIGVGFKGGEVTPLFFVGAALGNALCVFVPLPMALLAGMGFVAVFAGATHAPIACTIMGMELFGSTCGVYVGIACVLAYFFSGHIGIYSSQELGKPKSWIYANLAKRKMSRP